VSLRLLLTTFAAGVLSTLAKPNYAICIGPALFLLAAYRCSRKQYVNWRLLTLGAFASIGVVLAWQYLFHRTSGMGGFGFAPFKVMGYLSPENLPLKFVLSILFPACVYFSYFRQARRDLALNLAWLAFLFGAFYTYFIIEPREWQSGNFLWSGAITLLILFVVSFIFFVQQMLNNARERPQKSARTYLCVMVFGLHLVSGLIWYYVQLTYPLYTWW
jgi:hypothetical protein